MTSHQIILSDEDLKNLVAIFNGILKYSDITGARIIVSIHDKITSQLPQLSQGTEAAQPVVVPAAPQEN